MSEIVRNYYQLTKPGIIKGNLLTCAAGFILASDGHVSFGLLGITLLGTALIIAAACVVNNIIDRDIDRLMTRTKQRALAVGAIRIRFALLYATVLAVCGLALHIIFVNVLTAVVGLVGFLAYTILYSYAKRHSVHGTLVGTISGATPPVAGYTAVTGRLDIGALLLFLILVFWQMPHFYAIAVYRVEEYKKANIPVLPLIKGMQRTKLEVLLYIVGFVVVCLLLSVLDYTGYTFAIIALLLGGAWLQKGLHGLRRSDDAVWGKQMFMFSLLVLLVTSTTLALSPWLP